MAMRADVPLVPIWIEGAPRGWEVYSALFMPARVRIIVGQPKRFEESHQDGSASNKDNICLEETTDASSQRIQAREEAVAWISGVMHESLKMGGHATEEVGIAGRKWLDS